MQKKERSTWLSQEELRKMFAMIKTLNECKKTAYKDANEYITTAIRNLKRCVKYGMPGDLLEYKRIGPHTPMRQTISIYKNPCNQESVLENMPCGVYVGEKRFRSYQLPVYNKDGSMQCIQISSVYMWKDEMKRAIHNVSKSIPIDPTLAFHSKCNYFRIGDKFFHGRDFFEYGGQAYNKKDWSLTLEGKLVDKVSSRELIFDTDSYYLKGFRYETVLIAEPGEKIVEQEPCEDSHKSFHIYIRHGSSTRGIGNFVASMFVLKDGPRLFPHFGDAGHLVFTKDEFMRLEFKPTEMHKIILKNLEAAYEKADLKKETRTYEKGEYEERKRRNGPKNNINSVSVKIEVPSTLLQGASIPARIFRELTRYGYSNKYLPIFTALKNIEALKRILEINKGKETENE